MKKKLLTFSFIFSFCINIYAQQFGQFAFQNRLRTYWLYLPKDYSPTEKLPLIIQMHGFTLDGKFHMQYTEFNKVADTARCIMVYPNGIDKRWNSGTFFFIQSGVDDVGFLAELIDRIHLKYNIDLEKVYAGGYSAGGFMSYKLACDLSNRIAAIAPVVASMVYDNINTCVPSRSMPMIACNGSSDPITPYNGIPLNFPSIDTIKKVWQEHNLCDVVPSIDTLPNLDNTDNSRVVTYTYNNCADNVTTKFYKILDGGHTWAGAPNYFLGLIGNTNNDIKWSSLSWNFFKQNTIPTNVICDAPQNLQAIANDTSNYLLTWDDAPNVNGYKIQLLDSANNTIKTYTSNTNSISIQVDDATKKYNWSVASNCNSGYRNWATPVSLNYIVSGIKKNSIKSIQLYPNPTTEFIKFELSNYNNDATVLIYDMNGKMVHQEQKSGQEISIAVTNLSNGIYMLHCITDKDIFQSKFVKQ